LETQDDFSLKERSVMGLDEWWWIHAKGTNHRVQRNLEEGEIGAHVVINRKQPIWRKGINQHFLLLPFISQMSHFSRSVNIKLLRSLGWIKEYLWDEWDKFKEASSKGFLVLQSEIRWGDSQWHLKV
jgi:hypothetical protein